MASLAAPRSFHALRTCAGQQARMALASPASTADALHRQQAAAAGSAAAPPAALSSCTLGPPSAHAPLEGRLVLRGHATGRWAGALQVGLLSEPNPQPDSELFGAWLRARTEQLDEGGQCVVQLCSAPQLGFAGCQRSRSSNRSAGPVFVNSLPISSSRAAKAPNSSKLRRPAWSCCARAVLQSTCPPTDASSGTRDQKIAKCGTVRRNSGTEIKQQWKSRHRGVSRGSDKRWEEKTLHRRAAVVQAERAAQQKGLAEALQAAAGALGAACRAYATLDFHHTARDARRGGVGAAEAGHLQAGGRSGVGAAGARGLLGLGGLGLAGDLAAQGAVQQRVDGGHADLNWLGVERGCGQQVGWVGKDRHGCSVLLSSCAQVQHHPQPRQLYTPATPATAALHPSHPSHPSPSHLASCPSPCPPRCCPGSRG